MYLIATFAAVRGEIKFIYIRYCASYRVVSSTARS